MSVEQMEQRHYDNAATARNGCDPTLPPPAAEARRMVDQGDFEKAKQVMAIATKAINTAIRNGQKRATVDGFMPQAVISELKRLGYEIETGSQYNESFTCIKW